MRLPDEYRVNHRAASESLLRAAAIESNHELICHELEKATYFAHQAREHVHSPRQRALSLGLLHAIDLLRAVADAEFHR